MAVVVALVVLVCGWIAPAAPAGAELRMRYRSVESGADPRSAYFLAVLRLALEQTAAADGPYRLVPSDTWMTQSRTQTAIRQGEIDILWTMTSKDREQRLLPIRIPLLKGLMGYRVLLVREKDLAALAAVETLDDLRRWTAGQGHDWPDTEILRANRFKVETSASYEGLFRMIRHRRFDFFPRSIAEVAGEAERWRGAGLVVEPHLALFYPAPIYFFVHPKRPKLAERIGRGLRRARRDGSFDRLLASHMQQWEGTFRMSFEGRTAFRLQNPLLPAETPLDETELWHPAVAAAMAGGQEP